MADASSSVALVQMQCGADPDANLEKAIAFIREAAKQGAQIVCLPELFRSPYFCQRQDPALFDLAEPIPGPSTERLGRVARETGTVVVASLFERRAAGDGSQRICTRPRVNVADEFAVMEVSGTEGRNSGPKSL